MKISNIPYWRLNYLFFLLISMSGCHQDPTLPLASYLGGRYEWTKTTTPTRTITPGTAGYHEDLTLYNDSKGQYIAFFRADTLFYLGDVSGTPTESDSKGSALLYAVRSSGNTAYIKIYLSFNADNSVELISTSRVMTTYTGSADTVRSFYQKTNLEPRKR